MEVFEIGTETKVRLRLNGKEVINNKLETDYLVLDEQPGLVTQNK